MTCPCLRLVTSIASIGLFFGSVHHQAFAEPPLADVPSEPGPHIAKIKALGDNQWLALGSPAADPKWGKARGRSWSSNQPAAPNLRGGFVFGEGVHAYVKPDGRYMNDLWFYDLNAHRWICLYPGIEVKTIAQRIRERDLVVDQTGQLVDQDGQPLPPLLIHAYGNLGYDPDRKQFVTFGGQFENYFTTGKNGIFEESNRLFQQRRQEKPSTEFSPFFYDVATGKFSRHPVDAAPKGGGGYGGNILVYVSSRKEFFFGGTDGVWYLDPEGPTWRSAQPEGDPPTEIDHAATYDPTRDRIYYQYRDGGSAEENFLIYDLQQERWIRPRPQGTAPFYSSS